MVQAAPGRGFKTFKTFKRYAPFKSFKPLQISQVYGSGVNFGHNDLNGLNYPAVFCSPGSFNTCSINRCNSSYGCAPTIR